MCAHKVGARSIGCFKWCENIPPYAKKKKRKYAREVGYEGVHVTCVDDHFPERENISRNFSNV